MRRSRVSFPLALACFAFTGPSCFSAAPVQPPPAREIIAVLETNRPAGMSQSDLDATIVRGIISSLEPRASLVEPGKESSKPAEAITSSKVFENSMAYLRVDTVNKELPRRVTDILESISSTNKIKGVVVDLRFSSGRDYAAAAETADLFIHKQTPMLDWGEGMKKSDASSITDAPVAVLVNEQTAGAAEALAGVLRETGTGLLLGSPTAGAAAGITQVKLSNGEILNIASRPVELGNGSRLNGKVKPDIEIQVSPEDERAYYADAFAVVVKTNDAGGGMDSTNAPDSGTNRTNRRQRFNEADLVREHSQGTTGGSLAPSQREPELPVVNDPVLARALDVLKGLAVVRQPRS